MAPTPAHPEPIAIVGMDCIFPGARSLADFWANTVRGLDATGLVPPSRWDPAAHGLGPVRAGCIDGLTAFDPLALGVMPAAVAEGDPEQFLLLAVVQRALRDALEGGQAGHGGAAVPSALPEAVRRRTEVVIGRGGYMGNGIEHLHLRTEVVEQVLGLLARLHPGLAPAEVAELRRALRDAAPSLTSESVAAALPNLNAGRVTNRLDLMGAAYTVDAACASALVATAEVMRSLREGRSDLGVAAAVHINQKPSIWLAFHTLGTLSVDGAMRPFDAAADGLVMGEGVGAIVLKRLADARRDGDRVYACLLAVGSASDGRATGLLTPRLEGEVLALRRAYEAAAVSPASVTLVEGHGAATRVGDRTEIAALREVFGDEPGAPVALGSVKSMIGHAMPAAGMAGLIKTALAIHHRILPPTLHVTRPHPDLDGGPFFINAAALPWIAAPGRERRAGVSAFGFGGINAHAVLEEAGATEPVGWRSLTPPSHELFLLAAATRAELAAVLAAWQRRLAAEERPGLGEVAREAAERCDLGRPERLAVVAADRADLLAKIELARFRLGDPGVEAAWTDDDSGVFYGSGQPPGKVAVVFPGIGFPGLAGGFTGRLGELCLHFPAARALLDLADSLVGDDGVPAPLHAQLFPPPLLSPDARLAVDKQLAWSPRTPIAFLMAHLAAWTVLDDVELGVDGAVGFSLGELAALIAAGALDTTTANPDLVRRILELLGDSSADGGSDDGLWAMVAAPAEAVETVLDRFRGRVSLAMDVSPEQSFIAGEAAAVRAVLGELGEGGVWSQELPQLPMLRPFLSVHTPRAGRLARRFKALLGRVAVGRPRFTVYGGSSARPYPESAREVRAEVLEGMTRPVRIRDAIRALYDDGFRVFVQLGAGGKLLANIHNTLAPRPHAAVAVDREGRGGLEQLLRALGQLAALGVRFSPAALHRRRAGPLPRGDASTAAAVLSLAPPRLDLHGAAAADVLRMLEGEPRVRAAVTGDDPGSVRGAEPLDVLDELLELEEAQQRSEDRILAELVKVQEELAAAVAPRAAGATPAVTATALPFIDEVLELVPDDRLEARLELDLERHLFLCDHTFVNLPDDLKPPSERLPTLPLTVGLEILAEAATLLAPGHRVVAIHDVAASRWIALESARRLALHITACRRDRGEVAVTVSTPGGDRPSLLGEVALAADYPPPPTRSGSAPEEPAPHRAEEFYATGPLFHGPRFRMIRRLLAIGPGTAAAEVAVSDPGAWFASPPSAPPVLEPVMLDALAQVAGYRAWLEGRLLLPVGLERLEIYAATPPPGSLVRGTVRLRPIDDRRVDIDIDADTGDGRPLLRLQGLRSWRIFCPPTLLELNHRPRDLTVARPWRGPGADRPCFRVRIQDLGDLGADWIARLYLTAEEWRHYTTLRRPDWLLGRIAAKDAVRAWLAARGEKTLHPLELQIGNDPHGAPVVLGITGPGPRLSISHLEDEAVAVTADDQGVGVDLAKVEARPVELVEIAFDEHERVLVGSSELALHRAWAAKEAAAKARGWGLEGLRRLRVTAVPEEGAVTVAMIDGGAAWEVPTWVEGARVIALSLTPP